MDAHPPSAVIPLVRALAKEDVSLIALDILLLGYILLLRYCRYEIILDGRQQEKEVEDGLIVAKIGGKLNEFSPLIAANLGDVWRPELDEG